MSRRLLAILGILTLGAVFTVRADVPVTPDNPVSAAAIKDLEIKKRMDAQKFREFRQALLRLAQRLEGSAKPEDRERAANIRKAIEAASSSGLDTRFDRLIAILGTSKDLKLQEVREAMAEQKMLVADIRAILALLLADNRDEQLRAERERLTNLIKQLDNLIRAEKLNRARVEGGRVDKRDLSAQERKNLKNAAAIARALDGKKDAKGEGKGESKGEGKGKDDKGEPKGDGKGKDGKGESKTAGKNEPKGEAKAEGKGKDSKGEGKSKGQGKAEAKDKPEGKGEAKGKGEGKGEGKGKGEAKGEAKGKGEGKGEAKAQGQGQGGESKGDGGDPPPPNKNQPSPESTPGKKQVKDAEAHIKQAEEEIEKDQRDPASQQQSKAIEELEKARRKLEEILKQLREEEIERLLAALQARCERMKQMQIEVWQGTIAVEKSFVENVKTAKTDPEINRGNVQKSLDLSKKEAQIVEEANKAIQLLEAEGTAVAFPAVFHQVRDDMKHVERRLSKADVGAVTQVIEVDIIKTLGDMIDALKKAQQEQQAKKSQPSPPSASKPQDQKLLDILAELKMIRTMQVRVNDRTRVYGDQYTGEQASVPEIQKELNNLSQRQRDIFDITNKISKGKNK